jgi:alkanesulfonate monooxygenase SsuD/methylene tetrahydromethanopterin reductase-like flavin-dependent oxidoreductase (luciferase family)
MAEIAGGAPKPPGKGTMPEFYGDPDTVARQIQAEAQRIGFGVLDLSYDAFWLPHELGLRSLERFGREVMPQLTAVSPAT